jgi:hypothetical protein
MVDSDPSLRPARPGPPDATESALALAPAGAGGQARPDPGPRGGVRVGTGTGKALGHRGTASQSLTQSKSSAHWHASESDSPLLIRQRLRISLISTRCPQPIHRVIAVGRRWGRAGAGVQLESREGLKTLANFCECLEGSATVASCSLLPSILSPLKVGLIVNAITRCIFQSSTIQLNCKVGSAGIPPIEGI